MVNVISKRRTDVKITMRKRGLRKVEDVGVMKDKFITGEKR